MPARNRESAIGPNRRDVLATAGVAAAAATLPRLAASAAPAPDSGTFWSKEYWAAKGPVKLNLFRKRRNAPAQGQAALPVLVLVHGSSISSRPSFDLTVPGAGEYSLMNVFARNGYDVWTMDFEGYGRSTVTKANSDIKSGVEDLKAATKIVAQETGRQKFHIWGESSGALRAAAFAVVAPEHVDRLVLGAFTYTGKGSPTLADRAKQVEFYRTHNRRPRDIDMIRSIFTRDRPGTSDPRVAEAMAAAELPFGDSVPTGTYLDMSANLPVVDPKKVRAPVLMVRGQYDGIATEEDILDFFRQLPNPDRQLAILPGLAHSLTMGLNRQELWHVAQAFLSLPHPKVV
jgi:alpha-beta hydrolase superfamily lysophospholipase